jgi:hypothetical protein
MPLVEFPYTLHQGYAILMIPTMDLAHKIRVFVDSVAVFSRLHIDAVHRLGIDWARGRRQRIVVGDGSFIPNYIHDLFIHIGPWEVTAPVGFSERREGGFNVLRRIGIFNHFRSASMIAPTA